MMNERVTELTKYLTALSDAQRSGYKCNGEIAEVIRELRFETGLFNAEDKARVYHRKIVELCGDHYKEYMRFINAQIYNAYLSGIDGDLFVARCTGTTTSLKALAETFEDVVYINDMGVLTSPNVAGKVVFTEGRKKLPCGTRPKCVINIKQIDFTGDNTANVL